MKNTSLSSLDKILGEFANINLEKYNSYEEVFEYFTKAVAEALNIERVSVWYYTTEAIELKKLYSSSNDTHSKGGFILKTEAPRYFEAIESGFLSIEVEDALTDLVLSDFKESYLIPNKIGALLDLPLRLAGQFTGVLCCEHTGSKREWTNEEVSFTRMVANTLCMIIGQYYQLELQSKIEHEKDLLRQVLDNIPAVVYLKDEQSRRLISNKKEQEFIGAISEVEVIGKTDEELGLVGRGSGCREEDLKIIDDSQPILGIEVTQENKTTGELHSLLGSKLPINFSDGSKGVLGIGVDVTERNKIYDQLVKNEEKYRFIAEHTTDGIFISENDKITYYSPSLEKLIGYTQAEMEEIFMGDLYQLIHPEDRDEIRKQLWPAVKRLEPVVELIYRFKHKDGKYIWHKLIINYFYNEDGWVWRSVIIVRDMTDDVNSENQLQVMEERFRFITENSTDGIIIVEDKEMVYYSPACERILGYSFQEIKEMTLKEHMAVIHPDDRADIKETLLSGRLEKENVIHLRHRSLLKSGGYIWQDSIIHYFYDESGSVWRMMIILRDVTESIRSEQRIRASEEMLSNILNSLDEIVWALSYPDFKPMFISNSFEDIYGYPVEVWYEDYRIWAMALHPDDKHIEEWINQEIQTKGFAKGEFRMIDSGGEEKWLSVQVKLVTNELDGSSMILGSNVDITYRKMAENELMKSEKSVRDILDSLDEAVWALKLPEFKPLFVSKSFENLYGFSFEEWEEDNYIWESIVHEEDSWVVPYYKPDWTSGRPVNATVRIKGKEGDVKWVENLVKTAFDHEGNPYLLLGIGLDRTEKVEAEEKLNKINQRVVKAEKARADLELRTLQMQMNPHFIFNALNSIQSFILKNDIIATNDYMSKFASLIRSFLDSSRNMKVSLREEVRLLKLYIEMERMRFEDKFDYKIEVESDVDMMIEIPGMMLQPFVENAINHGLRYKENKGFLKVHFMLDRGKLCCTVQDDGVGREKSNSIRSKVNKGYVSQGLKITKERLDIYNVLNRTQLDFKIEDLNPGAEDAGTKVMIHFPL
ncbi:PAS domain S-box protein [Jiulongibacter sp. NS-SX5]|uniref:PAS domain S-box protein n=1 Tax=Jiulongibacter sp. NS-SX5 TaxID=3463854 RepID=UPI004058E1C7